MHRYAYLKSTVDSGNYEQKVMCDMQQRIRDRWGELPPFTNLDNVIINDLEWKMSKQEFLDKTIKGRQEAQANSAWNNEPAPPNPPKNRNNRRGGAKNRKNSAGSWNSNKFNQFHRQNNNQPRRQSHQDNRPGSSNEPAWTKLVPRSGKSPDAKRPKWDPQPKKSIPCQYEDKCKFKDTCQYAHSPQEIRQYHESS